MRFSHYWARPCTQVRILPFHPTCCHAGYSHKEFSRFRLRRLCSHLYNISVTTGVTRYRSLYYYRCVRTFLPTASNEAIIMPGNYAIKSIFWEIKNYSGWTTSSPTLILFLATKPEAVSITYNAGASVVKEVG